MVSSFIWCLICFLLNRVKLVRIVHKRAASEYKFLGNFQQTVLFTRKEGGPPFGCSGTLWGPRYLFSVLEKIYLLLEMAEGGIDQQQNEANQSIKTVGPDKVDCKRPPATTKDSSCHGPAAGEETKYREDVCSKSEVVEDPYAKLPDSLYVLRVNLVANRVKKFIDVKPSSFSKTKEAFHMWATNDKYIDFDSSKTGKWMLFVETESVDAIWTKIMASIISGALWMALVLYDTHDPAHQPNKFAIMVYTVDYTDLDDVIRVLDYLQTTGLKRDKDVIVYKTDDQTRAGIYRWKNNGRPWIYSSLSVRGIRKKEYKNSKIIPLVEFEKSRKFY